MIKPLNEIVADIAKGQGKKHANALMTKILHLMCDFYYNMNIMYEYYLLFSIDNQMINRNIGLLSLFSLKR